jgi:hypothetical protein
MKKKYSFFILFLLPLIVKGHQLVAQEQPPRAPVVLEITRPSKSTDELQLQRVISEAIRLELARAGMEVIPLSRVEGTRLGNGYDASQDVDLGKTFDLAASLGADYVLFCIYSRYADEIRLDFAFNDVRKRSLAAIVSRSRRIGLTLDVVVTECIQEIVAKIGGSLTDLPQREVKEEAMEVVERHGTETKESKEAEVARDEPALVEKEPELAESFPAEKEEAVVETGRDDMSGEEMTTKRFELSVGFAPFLVVGEASNFFKIGLSPSFCGSYWFSFPFGHIGLGLYAAIHLFRVEELESTSQSYLLPFGVDLRYETKNLRPLSVYVRASGGPSLLTLSLDERGSMSKLIYYALAGIGINIPFTRLIGLCIDSSYIIFIDDTDLIMGFNPSANILLRF